MVDQDYLLQAALGALEGFNAAYTPYVQEQRIRGRKRQEMEDELAAYPKKLALEEPFNIAKEERRRETLKSIPRPIIDSEGNIISTAYGQSPVKLPKPTVSTEEKEGQKRKVKLEGGKNKALTSFRNADANLDSLVRSVDELLDDPGLSKGTGTSGAVLSKVPFIANKAKDIQSRIKVLKSKTSLNALQEMRANSPTGGALGQVSDAEGIRLENNIAAMNEKMTDDEFVNQLVKLRRETESSRSRLREAYELDYGEPTPARTTSAPAPKSGSGLTPEQRKARIKELRKRRGK